MSDEDKVELVVQLGSLPKEESEVFKDARTALILCCERLKDTFFEQQDTELEPMLFLYSKSPSRDEVDFIMATPATIGDGYKKQFVDIIRTSRQHPDFIGAIMMSEGYETTLKDGEPSHRREVLCQYISDNERSFQVRVSPFKRDSIPGIPTPTGATVAHEIDDENRLFGVLVPD